MKQLLEMWTVYERPSDFPESFIARKHVVHAGGTVPSPDCVESPTLEGVREFLEARGLTCLPRSPGDDPVIVETWL